MLRATGASVSGQKNEKRSTPSPCPLPRERGRGEGVLVSRFSRSPDSPHWSPDHPIARCQSAHYFRRRENATYALLAAARILPKCEFANVSTLAERFRSNGG